MPKINYLKFSQNIKSQYPEYKDWNDIELAKYFVAQEPRYSESVDFGDLKKKDQVAPSLGAQGGLPSQQPSVQPRRAKEERFFGGAFGDVLDMLDMPTPGVPGSGLGIGDFIDDMGRAFSSGKKAGVNMSASRPLFFSGPGSSDEEVQNFVKAGTEYTGPSDEATQFYKDYEDNGKTTFGFVKALAKNPGIAPELVVQSASQLLFNPEARAAAGSVILGGASAGAIATAPAGGIGAAPGAIASIPLAVAAANTTVSTLSSFSELMKKELDDRGLEFNEDNVRTILEDENALRKIRAKSAGYGITIGAFDLATAKVGGAIAAKIPMSTRAGKIKATLSTTGVEAVGGSAGEAAARGVTGQELDPAEIGLEGIAEIPGAAPTLLSQVLKRPAYKINGEFVGQADVEDILQNSTRQELENTKLEVFNDEAGYGKKIANRIDELKTRDAVIEANPNASEQEIGMLVGLNTKLKNLNEMDAESAKIAAETIRSEIKTIQKNLLQREISPETEQQAEQIAPEAPQMAPAEVSPEVGMEIPQVQESVLEGPKMPPLEDLEFDNIEFVEPVITPVETQLVGEKKSPLIKETFQGVTRPRRKPGEVRAPLMEQVTEGGVFKAKLRDSRTGTEFVIEDPELSLDLAIAAQVKESGRTEFPQPALLDTFAEVIDEDPQLKTLFPNISEKGEPLSLDQRVVSLDGKKVTRNVVQRVQPIYGALEQRMNNAEEIPVSEIESVVDQVIQLQQEIQNQKGKKTVRAANGVRQEFTPLNDEQKRIFNDFTDALVNKLLSYDFATTTTTGPTTQKTTAAGLIATPREGRPLQEARVQRERLEGAEVTIEGRGRGRIAIKPLPGLGERSVYGITFEETGAEAPETISPTARETGTTPAAVGVEPQTEQNVRQETNASQEGRSQGEDAAPVPQEEGRQEGQVTPPAVVQEGETPPATAKKPRKTAQEKEDEGKATLEKLKETLRALRAKPDGGANIDLTFGVVPITKAVWNTAIDTAVLAVDAGQSIAQAVKAASDYISSKIDGDWGKAKFGQYMEDLLTEASGMIRERVSYTPFPEGLGLADGWYSTTEKRVREVKQDKQSASAWLNSGLIGKGDEATYTGVRGWLEGKKPNEAVSKQEILDWMNDNRVEIKEVTKGERLIEYPEFTKEDENKLAKLQRLNDENPGGAMEDVQEGSFYEFLDLLNKKEKSTAEDLSDRREQAEKKAKKVQQQLGGKAAQKYWDESNLLTNRLEAIWLRNDDNFGLNIDDTKYAKRQLEGKKENYKEVLVTLPTLNELPQGWTIRLRSNVTPGTADRPFGVYDPDGKLIYTAKNETDGKAILRRYEKTEPKTFQSTHFDEPNILVHLRMNTRTDADGNMVLFLEEVQSDWGQSYKKEQGSKKATIYDAAKDIYNGKKRGDKEQFERGVNKAKQNNISEKEISDALDEYGDFTKPRPTEIPTAPFVTDTNAWTKLGLKVALQEAVRQGADKIAWTTGEQQNERYDLSKQVDYITKNVDKINEDRSYVDISTTNGLITIIIDNRIEPGKILEVTNQGTSDMVGKNIEDVVGKDVATRIIDGKDGLRLEGEGLKLGGKGMKGFYDKIVPDAFKSVVKELTGQDAVISETTLNTPEKTIQQSIPLTTRLKEQIERGMPLFEGEKASVQQRAEKVRGDITKATEALTQAQPEAKVKKSSPKPLTVFHAGTLEGKGNIYVSPIREQANEYSSMSGAPVLDLEINENAMAPESEVRDLIQSLGLKLPEGYNLDELFLYEALDTRVGSSLSQEDIDKLYKSLKDRGYEGIAFRDEDIRGIKKEGIDNFIVFDKSSLSIVGKPQAQPREVEEIAKALEGAAPDYTLKGGGNRQKRYSIFGKAGLAWHGGDVLIKEFDKNKIKGGFRGELGYGYYFGSSSKPLDYGSSVTFIDIGGLKLINGEQPFSNKDISILEEYVKKTQDSNNLRDGQKKLYAKRLIELADNSVRDATNRVNGEFSGDASILFSEIMTEIGYDGMQVSDNWQIVLYPQEKLNDLIVDPNQHTAEAYVQAKADGSNPELVKAVDELLRQTTEAKQEKTIAEKRKEFRETAKKYFEGMKKMGIIFDAERNAAEDIAFIKALTKYIKLEIDNGMVTFKGFIEKTAGMIEDFNDASVKRLAKDIWSKEVVKAYPKLYAKLQKAQKATLEQEIARIRKEKESKLSALLSPKALYLEQEGKLKKRRISMEAAELLSEMKKSIGNVKELGNEELIQYVDLGQQIFKAGRAEAIELRKANELQAKTNKEKTLLMITDNGKRESEVIEPRMEGNEEVSALDVATEVLKDKVGSVIVEFSNGEVYVYFPNQITDFKNDMSKDGALNEVRTFRKVVTSDESGIKNNLIRRQMLSAMGSLNLLVELLKGKSKASIDWANNVNLWLSDGASDLRKNEGSFNRADKKNRLDSFGKVVFSPLNKKKQGGYVQWGNRIAKMNGKRINLRSATGQKTSITKAITNDALLNYYSQILNPKMLSGGASRKINLDNDSINTVLQYMSLPENAQALDYVRLTSNHYEDVRKRVIPILESQGYSTDSITRGKLDINKAIEEDPTTGRFLRRAYDLLRLENDPDEALYFPSSVEPTKSTELDITAEDLMSPDANNQKALSALSNNLISTTEGGKLVAKGFSESIKDYNKSMANMIGKLGVLNNMRSSFNAENMKAMSNVFGKAYSDRFRERVRYYFTQIPAGSDGRALKAPEWFTIKTSLPMFFNRKSGFLQTLQTLAFIPKFGFKNYYDGIRILQENGGIQTPRGMKYRVGLSREILQNELVQARIGARFDISVRDLNELVRGDDKSIVIGGVPFTLKKLLSVGYLYSTGGDLASILTGGMPVYAKLRQDYINQYSKTMSAEDANEKGVQKALTEFADIIDKTQQTSREDLLSAFETDPTSRLLLSFATIIPQSSRMAIVAGKRIQIGEGNIYDNVAQIAYFGLLSSAFFNLVSQGIDDLFDPEEEDETNRRKKIEALKKISLDVIRDLTKSFGWIGVSAQATVVAAKKLDEGLERGSSGKQIATDIALETVSMVPQISIIRRDMEGLGRAVDMDQMGKAMAIGVQLITNFPAENTRKMVQDFADIATQQYTISERLMRGIGILNETWAESKSFEDIWQGKPGARERLTPARISALRKIKVSEYQKTLDGFAEEYAEAKTQAEKDAIDSRAMSLIDDVSKAKDDGEGEANTLYDYYDKKMNYYLKPKDVRKVIDMNSEERKNYVEREYRSILKKDGEISADAYILNLYEYEAISQNEFDEIFVIINRELGR